MANEINRFKMGKRNVGLVFFLFHSMSKQWHSLPDAASITETVKKQQYKDKEERIVQVC